MGQSPSSANYTSNPDDYVLVQGNADLQNGWVYPRVWTTQVTKTADPGTLIMSVRAPVGAMGKTAYKVVLGRGVAGIQGPEILFQLFKKYESESYWIKKSTGSTFDSINGDELKNTLVTLPNLSSEQTEIENLLLRLDFLIALHQRKLDAIKKIKSALLEKMFPKDGSDIPEIRFTGFTEAWEQRKLGDYGLVQMCRRIYKDQTSEIGDVPFFKIGTFGGQPDAFISRSLFQDYRKQYPFPSVGTPLISAAGSIGRTVIYQGEEAYFQDSNIVWLDNNEKLNNVFLNSLYKKIDWKLEGSTIKRLYNKDILNAEVCVPSTLEQCQVGSFFAHLDSLITLHQRKLDALKKIKSALLEKMFV